MQVISHNKMQNTHSRLKEICCFYNWEPSGVLECDAESYFLPFIVHHPKHEEVLLCDLFYSVILNKILASTAEKLLPALYLRQPTKTD